MVEHQPGTFFLGGILDPDSAEPTGDSLVYEARHLTTHGVIVGMTGSGKTGLGIVALEEALLSGIPCVILDPKGDMGNLLLTFPDLEGSDFRPWVDEAEGRRRGLEPETFAEETARSWREGLGRWGLDCDRIRRLREVADLTIFTPGSASGVPLNVVGSLEAPSASWETEAETLREEIESFTSSLLSLAQIDADPISSPDHILIANLIEHAWREGRGLDLATLIGQVQAPPLRKLGVFDLDTFFPPAERRKLAMRLNGLVASPSFAQWLQGEPLEAERLLRAPDGRPRASVIYLAHLSDVERRFVVTLVLSKMVTWMRSQPGTSELRALIYMDEVFGFAPPTAEPPSKKPILTILKQARAHGLGMILATQNPVDLDYKAMSNAGTWMVGRLQTERDKARILEALRSASGSVDVAAFDRLIGGLGKRQFVFQTTRSPEPTLFTTRWAMSYLRGALTRDEVGKLMAGRRPDPIAPAAATTPTAGSREGTPPPAGGPPTDPAPALGPDESLVPPEVHASVPALFLDAAAPWAREIGAHQGSTRFEAGLAARVRMTFDDQHAGVDHDEEWEAVFFPLPERFDPEEGRPVDYDDRDFTTTPPPGAVYRIPRAPLDNGNFFRDVRSSLAEHLYRTRAVHVFKNGELKLYSRVGEDRNSFLDRCRSAAEDRADEEVAGLRDRYEVRFRRAREQIEVAERRMRELEVDVSSRKQQELVAGAGALLSAFLGGRLRTRGLSGIASRRSQVRRTQERLNSVEERHEDRVQALEDLERELERDIEDIRRRWDDAADGIETLEIGLEKSDISVDRVAVVWIPAG